MHRAQPYTIGFEGDLEFIARFEREAIPQTFRHNETTHLIKRQFHGNSNAIWQYGCQMGLVARK